MNKGKLISSFAFETVMAEAMAEMEGFNLTAEQWRAQGKKLPTNWKEGDPISLAQKNKNPVNLRSWGDQPIVGGYAQFDQVEEGWAAARQQCRYNIWSRKSKDPYKLRVTRPMSLREFFAGQRGADGKVIPTGYPGFAPAVDGGNKPVIYAEAVLEALKRGFTSLDETVTIDTPIRPLVVLA